MIYSGYIYPVLSVTSIKGGIHVLIVSFPLMSFANGAGVVDDSKIPMEILANPNVGYLTECNEIYMLDDKFYEAKGMDSVTIDKIRYTSLFFTKTSLPKHALLVYEQNTANMMEALSNALNQNTTATQ